ncbi:MAG TPA: TetR/AcrR family transcriptional regulator [Solirubrobacteraceae bacterium]
MTDLAAEGRRQATKQANREAIVAAAREVFAELGYGAATVRDIVRRTDLATGTFYNYFPDKEAVFRALLEESAREAREVVRAARRAAGDAESFVRDGFRAYFEFLGSDRTLFEIMRRNAGTIRAQFDTPALGAGTDELEADLRRAVDAGLLAPHDARYMAAAMVGAGFELAVRMLESDTPDVEGAVNFATSLFAPGLTP